MAESLVNQRLKRCSAACLRSRPPRLAAPTAEAGCDDDATWPRRSAADSHAPWPMMTPRWSWEKTSARPAACFVSRTACATPSARPSDRHPVAESGIVGAAFGMAVAGMNPIVELQFMGFSYPAFDQIVNHVARIRNRSRHRFIAPMTIRIPFGEGSGRPSTTASRWKRSTRTRLVSRSSFPRLRTMPRGCFWRPLLIPTRSSFLNRSVCTGRCLKKFLTSRTRLRSDRLASSKRVRRNADFLRRHDEGDQCRRGVLAEDGVSVEVIDLRTLVPSMTTRLSLGQQDWPSCDRNEAAKNAGFAAEVAAEIGAHALYSLEAQLSVSPGGTRSFPSSAASICICPVLSELLAAARRTLDGS